MTTLIKNKLKTELEICSTHDDRLQKSLNHLLPLLPITPQFIENAKDEDLAYLDMVTMRFAKLQDAIGKKLFPLILRLIAEYDQEETFIDRLNHLERLNVIDSVQHWQELHNIRIVLANEYENDLVKLCEILNYFIKKCHELSDIWKKVQTFIFDKKLLTN